MGGVLKGGICDNLLSDGQEIIQRQSHFVMLKPKCLG